MAHLKNSEVKNTSLIKKILINKKIGRIRGADLTKLREGVVGINTDI